MAYLDQGILLAIGTGIRSVCVAGQTFQTFAVKLQQDESLASFQTFANKMYIIEIVYIDIHTTKDTYIHTCIYIHIHGTGPGPCGPPPEGEKFPVIALDYQHRRSASALFQ